ncbi:MAG TPA: AIM24 family protein [Tepidiformaceae bacterium]
MVCTNCGRELAEGVRFCPGCGTAAAQVAGVVPPPPPVVLASTPPVLLPTQLEEGVAPGLRYRIDGELVPVLHISLDGSVGVYFEHHVILWKNPAMAIGMHPLAGGFKRMMAGMPIFMTETQSAGEVAFSRDDPGHVLPLHLLPGQGVLVREHQFLAATNSIDYSFTRVKGVTNMLFGGTGFFIDHFKAKALEGVVWLHGYGNVFEKMLAPGEAIDVESGAWVYRDESVDMQQTMYGLKTGMFGGSGNLIFNRFTGPGRVGIQSAYVHMPTEN